jgi:hypothetical protein
VDLKAGKLIKQIPDQKKIQGIAYAPDLDRIYVETGREVMSVARPEDIDDLFYDAKNKRLSASCGAGALAVIRQRDADHYETLETFPTVAEK